MELTCRLGCLSGTAAPDRFFSDSLLLDSKSMAAAAVCPQQSFVQAAEKFLRKNIKGGCFFRVKFKIILLSYKM